MVVKETACVIMQADFLENLDGTALLPRSPTPLTGDAAMRHAWMVIMLALAGPPVLVRLRYCPGQAHRAEILKLGRHHTRPSHGRDGPLG